MLRYSAKIWLDYPSSEWTFAEYRVGDESARNDGGFVARVRAHHAGRHEDVEGACHFQPQQRPRPLQFLAKCAWPCAATLGELYIYRSSWKLFINLFLDLEETLPDYPFPFQAQTDGIVMVSFYPHFISCGEKSTLEDVAGKQAFSNKNNG